MHVERRACWLPLTFTSRALAWCHSTSSSDTLSKQFTTSQIKSRLSWWFITLEIYTNSEVISIELDCLLCHELQEDWEEMVSVWIITERNTNSDASLPKHIPICIWFQLSKVKCHLAKSTCLWNIQGMRVRGSNFYQANAIFSLGSISLQKCFIFYILYLQCAMIL